MSASAPGYSGRSQLPSCPSDNPAFSAVEAGGEGDLGVTQAPPAHLSPLPWSLLRLPAAHQHFPHLGWRCPASEWRTPWRPSLLEGEGSKDGVIGLEAVFSPPADNHPRDVREGLEECARVIVTEGCEKSQGKWDMQTLGCVCKPQACRGERVCHWVHRKWLGGGQEDRMSAEEELDACGRHLCRH